MHRALLDIGHKQMPFATALGLTNIAKAVQASEATEIDKTFDHPTPFTEKAFAIVPAKKDKPIAIVFAKDVQAGYLAPYVLGGDRSLGGKRGMLVPIGAATNAYGNLSKGQLARFKAMPNVFIGPVTTKSGRTINGVWQRPKRGQPARAGKRGAVRAKPAGPLKLLIEFTDTTPVRKRLDFEGRARATVRLVARREFEAALNHALATARK